MNFANSLNLLLYRKLQEYLFEVLCFKLRVTIKHKSGVYSIFDKRIAQAYYLLFFLTGYRSNIKHVKSLVNGSPFIVRSRVEVSISKSKSFIFFYLFLKDLSFFTILNKMQGFEYSELKNMYVMKIKDIKILYDLDSKVIFFKYKESLDLYIGMRSLKSTKNLGFDNLIKKFFIED